MELLNWASENPELAVFFTVGGAYFSYALCALFARCFFLMCEESE